MIICHEVHYTEIAGKKIEYCLTAIQQYMFMLMMQLGHVQQIKLCSSSLYSLALTYTTVSPWNTVLVAHTFLLCPLSFFL